MFFFNQQNLHIQYKTGTWFSLNYIAKNSTIKYIPSIEITTSGREQVNKSRTYHSLHDKNFIFFFLFFITFCIKLKSFFSLQHTLSCESDVKEVKRVGQKTLWRHNILQAYKVQKVEKRVDLHLIAVYYNKGERQKRHTPKNLTVHSSLQSNPIQSLKCSNLTLTSKHLMLQNLKRSSS